MSLLNEALRKNKLKEQYRVSPEQSPEKTFKAKRPVLFGAIAFAAVLTIWFISPILINRFHASDESLPPLQSQREILNDMVRKDAASGAGQNLPETDHSLRVKEENEPAGSFEIKASESSAIIALKDKSTEIGKNQNQSPKEGPNDLNEMPVLRKPATESEGEIRAMPKDSAPIVAAKENIDDKKDQSSNQALFIESAEKAENFYKKALQLHRSGRVEEAIKMYREALKILPDYTEANINMASAYIEISDFSAAYTLLTRVLNSNQANPEVLLNLAVAEIGLGRYPDAAEHLKRIDDEDDELSFSKFFHLGVAMSRIGNTEDALAYYKKAEELKRDHPKLLYNLAILNDRLGKYKTASDYYSRLLTNGSSSPDESEALRARIKILQTYISGTELEKKP
jgi:tetratricopeptide (TPR) repeat protein